MKISTLALAAVLASGSAGALLACEDSNATPANTPTTGMGTGTDDPASATKDAGADGAGLPPR